MRAVIKSGNNILKYLNHALILDVNAPAVSLLSSTWESSTEVTLAATIQPNKLITTVSLEFGLTTSYGETIAVGTYQTLEAVEVSITELLPYLTYHWRIKAENALGIIYSDDQTAINPLGVNQLFWLDGTISGTTLSDVSGNGRNFTINGKDFPSTWTKGFPYKSAATISAPAGDAVLIAADINNFLYDSGGTPNQIPVVSLFQDIDYEHKLFTRHVDQVIDGNGVETYEPRVLDIVLYDTVKSDADLTRCQSYFGVPTEVTTAIKWVSKNGNDSTGNGSKSNPWLTLTKAEASSSTNDLIYVKSGIYNETNYFYPRKTLNWKGLGLSVIKSTGTSWTVLSELPENNYLDGFIIDGEGNKSNNISIYFSSTYNKCMLIGAKTGNNNIVKILGGSPIFNNSIIVGGADYGFIETTKSFIIETSLIKTTFKQITTASLIFVFTNNKIITDNTGFNFISITANSSINLLGNTIQIKNINKFINLTTITKSLATAIINYNKVNIDTCVYSFVYNTDESFTTVTMIGNLFINNSNCKIIINTSSSDYVIDSNVIKALGTGSGIVIDKTSTTPSTVKIRNNTVLCYQSVAGYGIMVGNESVDMANSTITDIEISGNKVIGHNSSIIHGIFIGHQNTTVNIKYNNVSGCGFGIGFKGLSFDYTGTIVQYNIITLNNLYGVVFVGAKNVTLINNTIVNNVKEIYFSKSSSGGDGSTGQTIKNNIISNNLGVVYHFVDSESLVGHTIDKNVIYFTDYFFWDSTEYKTLAQWQALGYDTHSIVLTTEQYNNLFTDPDNADYSLAVGSIAIGAGVDLGTDYDDGLDVSTAWGSDTEIPVVVTKQQAAAWDCGAYVH